MSDGEGKGSRLGDIVLFASWHHNQEEEEEDVEGETEECHGLKRAAQTLHGVKDKMIADEGVREREESKAGKQKSEFYPTQFGNFGQL